jgi:hypothetical protein
MEIVRHLASSVVFADHDVEQIRHEQLGILDPSISGKLTMPLSVGAAILTDGIGILPLSIACAS